MTTLRRALTTTRLPLTTGWGIRLALLTAVISGVSVWLNGFAVKQVPDPAVYTTLKNLIAALILIGGASLMGGVSEARTLSRGQWRTLLIVGVIGGSIPFLLFFTGLAQVTAPGAAFIQKTLFIWVALLAVPFLGEKLGGLQIGALAVLVLGQFLLAPPKLEGAGWGSGETMIAAATALWAIEVVIVKKLLVGVSPAVVGASRLGFGVVFLFGYLAITGGLSGIAALSAEGWMWVLITGVFLAGYVGTWFAALRRAPASAVAAVLVVGAVITAILQALSNGVMPSETAVVGIVTLIVAAALVAWGALHAAARRDPYHRRRLIRGSPMPVPLPAPPRDRSSVRPVPGGTTADQVGFPQAHRPPPSGPVLFARYAFGPNRFGLCGPEDWRALLELGASGSDDRALRHLAQGFEGAYPYLQLLAESAGLPDPLDRRVVEAYWIGSPLSDAVDPGLMARSLAVRFRPRLDAGTWRWVSEKPGVGARPTHAFHVLDVFPRVGLMRGGKVDDVVGLMDSCRIRWGRVLDASGEQLVVDAVPLELVDGQLRLGAARVERVQRWLDGAGFLDAVLPGDVVTVHWDWACERLSPARLHNLVTRTISQIAIANQTL